MSEICSRSEDRIGGGFSVTVLTRCTGEKDQLFQDSVRMTLQSGNKTLRLMFPISVSLQATTLLMVHLEMLTPIFFLFAISIYSLDPVQLYISFVY